MNETQTPAAELATLFPEPKVITVAGKEIAIKPLTIRQLGAVSASLDPIIAAFDDTENLNIAKLIGTHTEHAIRAIAAATAQPEDWIAGLLPNDFVTLATAAWEVNRNFLPLGPVLAAVPTAMASAGPGPASSAT